MGRKGLYEKFGNIDQYLLKTEIGYLKFIFFCIKIIKSNDFQNHSYFFKRAEGVRLIFVLNALFRFLKCKLIFLRSFDFSIMSNLFLHHPKLF